ncbi:MAG: hypothetical protein Q7R82_00200 [Candidatus Daviesbacteria bacterium]|nr:hypothetical protein [Candidatus Daviesbacteria bacterium]
MGRPRVKIIDDAQEEAEKKASSKKVKQAKSESDKASSEIHPTTPVILEGAKRPIESKDKDAIASLQHDKKKTTQKPGKAKPRSKKYQELSKDLDRTKTYPLAEAVEMIKKLSYSKFNGTLEAHINTAQTGIRGLVSLPYAAGRKLRILTFGPSTGSTPLTTSSLGIKSGTENGVIIGSDEIIEEINTGKINFDIVVTTPEWMPKLAKVARILGPRGLMPNPKNGTITSPSADGLKKAVQEFQAGKTEYKTEAKAPVIHLALGKLNQPNEELIANIKTLYQTIGKSRIKKISLSPTMGPSVKVNLISL